MISTQVKELLEITGKCNGNQYLHDDLTINWYEVRELLLKDYVEGVLESYEYCVKIKPTLDSIILNCLQIQDQPELFKKTILEFSQWTHSTSELCKIFIDWCDESEDYSILTTLQLTSMLEYALGSLYQSEKRVPPPHLLKDLLAELSDESSLEFEKVFLLRLVLGTSKGLNLRNIVWHGFIDSIHRCYPAFLFVIIVSYGKSLKCKKIAPKLRSEINFSISLQSKNIQVEDLLKSPTIMKCNFNLWKQIVSLQKRKKFKSSIFLLLSQIESVLRFIYGRINQVNVTARLNKYYVIMDSIFYDYVLDDDVTPLVIGKINKSQHTQIKETNRKNQMMETFPLSIIYLGYDLFHAVDGPRIRDRISHAEVFVKDENFSWLPALVDISCNLCFVLFLSIMMEINGTLDNKNIFNFDDLESSTQELVLKAIEARNFAYCPYSKFAVGAALRATTGEIFTGCNIENGAHSPSLCAERTAIAKAVSEGFRSFTEIAVVAYQEESFTPPCGVCRQTLSEFAPTDMKVYLAKPSPGRVLVTSVFQLLPYRFNPEKLKK
ncbi:CLUMA_CG017854, isoform A [Clunio marinus]|uniref:cytidine deaminase n=1 Tax=Clunio marinus TaxID=568069 RepID=A0A1J1J056_9DIPT|nr:CLUMA_CG017854, isoform A [Clunio marinus]